MFFIWYRYVFRSSQFINVSPAKMRSWFNNKNFLPRSLGIRFSCNSATWPLDCDNGLLVNPTSGSRYNGEDSFFQFFWYLAKFKLISQQRYVTKGNFYASQTDWKYTMQSKCQDPTRFLGANPGSQVARHFAVIMWYSFCLQVWHWIYLLIKTSTFLV